MRQLHILSDSELTALKSVLLVILGDVDRVCKKYGITYMLGGGSVLGAVRHKGFIPWDDDLDLIMLRPDYNRFIEVFQSEMSESYDLLVPNSLHGVSHTFMKIVMKNTLLEDIYSITANYSKGICVDVFPLEFTYESTVLRKIKGVVADALAYISVSRYIKQHWNSYSNEFYNQTLAGRRSIRFRLLLGTLLSWIDYKTMYNFYDRFVQCKMKSTWATIPTGRNHYSGEAMSIDVFLPVTMGEFEGRKVPLPGQYDKFLQRLYGNYLEIPPEHKRERHYYVNIELPTH